MGQIIYTLQFKGRAAPVGGSSNVVKATATASSCTIATVVSSDGVRGTLEPGFGSKAVFESEVTLTGEASFKESGTISFGDGGHRLRFSTVGQGRLGPSADSKLKHGAVVWQVDGGEGQFEGATGLITANFTVSDAGEIVDNQCGLIWVK